MARGAGCGESDSLVALLREVAPLVTKYLEQRLRVMKEYEYPRFSLSVKVFGLLLGVVVAASFMLTLVGKMSGESFSFLMGVVIGYVMSHLKSLVLVERGEK